VKVIFTILAMVAVALAIMSYFFMVAAVPVFIGLMVSELIGYSHIGWNVLFYPSYMFFGGLIMFISSSIISVLTVDQIDY
jgi:hypothetical protein